MPGEYVEAMGAVLREHDLRFGLIAASTGEVLAMAGKLTDASFCGLAGSTTDRWVCTDPAGLRDRFDWLSELEKTDPGLLPQMVAQEDCFVFFTKPRNDLLAVLGMKRRELEGNVGLLNQVRKAVDATLKTQLAQK